MSLRAAVHALWQRGNPLLSGIMLQNRRLLRQTPPRNDKCEGGHMKSTKVRFNSIDEYISPFPEDMQKILEELRSTIRAAAPK
jgi:hypothetical protein